MELIGREREREALAAAVAAGSGVVVLEGEPGIGKSRLLAYVAEAAAGGATVLSARASEYEADLPSALWTEALGCALPLDGGRHRTHRALRERLEALAEDAPVVVCLDDVHWADPASVDALAALVHRPPAGDVLLVLATRSGQLPRALGAVPPIRLGPLSEAEARELVGADASAVYAASGGNPFYLEQLVRAGDGAGEGASGDGTVPPAVAAALAAELAGLDDGARQLLDAAAVVGDPFELDLAAEVAGFGGAEAASGGAASGGAASGGAASGGEAEATSGGAALAALDDLLARSLVRPGGAPRRFAFRHPVVRHAVYEAAPGGWRLGAHARAAAALERRGAGVVPRAHHVEQAAGPGDEAAIALLSLAAAELQSPAPFIAARYYAAALRLTPDPARRTPLQARLADAQSAAGDAAGARETLLDALGTAEPADRLRLTVAVANTEWWLGRTPEARRRLQVALGELPAEPSADRIRLRLALALTSLMARDLDDARDQASDAAADARAIADPVFEAAALAGGAIARVSAGQGAEPVEAAAAALERLTPAQLTTRLPAFWMLGRSRRILGDHEAALADLERGAALALETGRDNVRLQLTVERAGVLIELGRLEEAKAAAEQGVELGRLAGNPPMLLWAHCAQSAACLAAGDVTAALRHATEAAESGVRADFHAAGQPGWCLGNALTAAGEPARGVQAMLATYGDVLPADRPAAAADLAAMHLAAGDVEAAAEVAPREAAVLLAQGRARRPSRPSGGRPPRRRQPSAQRRHRAPSPPRAPASPKARRSPPPATARPRWPPSSRRRPPSTPSARAGCATRRRASCGRSGTACAARRRRRTAR